MSAASGRSKADAFFPVSRNFRCVLVLAVTYLKVHVYIYTREKQRVACGRSEVYRGEGTIVCVRRRGVIGRPLRDVSRRILPS